MPGPTVSRHTHQTARRTFPLVLVAAMSLSACGGTASTTASSASSTGSTSAAAAAGAAPSGSAAGTPAGGSAQTMVDDAAKAITVWTGPSQSPAAASGKTIGVISCAQGAEGCVREAKGATEAATALGWKVINIDGQGDPQRQLAGMNSLLDQGASAIVLCSINAASIGDGMQRAKSKGVPVIAVVSPDPAPFGGVGNVGPDDNKAGQVLAAYISTQGGGKVAVFDHNENPAVADRGKGLLSGLKAYGGTDVVYNEVVTLSQIGAPEQQIMSAFLQSHPTGSFDWLYAGFDAMLTPLLQSAQRAGRTDFKAVSIDGNLQNLAFIRAGNLENASVGYPLEWAGWGAIDNLNRVFAGQKAVDESIPFRLLTKTNLPAEGKAFEGDFDFRAQYKKLWNK